MWGEDLGSEIDQFPISASLRVLQFGNRQTFRAIAIDKLNLR